MNFSSKLRILLILVMAFFATMGYSQSPPGSGWTNVFADEFGGNQINTNIWQVKNPNILGRERAFLPARVKVSGGTLKIENRFFNNENGGVPQGGWIQSKDEFAKPGRPKYGYYEARLRIVGPNNGKIWPAWWIWGNRKNGVITTEFDLMEYSGSSKLYFNSLATSSHHSINKQKIFPAPWNPNILRSDYTTPTNNAAQRNVFGGWHVWGMHWTPTNVTFYYDGQPYFETTAAGAADAANENLGLRLILSSSPHTKDVQFNNFGPGGFQPNNPSNTPAQPGDNLATLEVDWVRVWAGGTIGGGGGNGGAPVGSLVAFKPIQASWINRGNKPPLGYISARFDDGGLVKSSAATSPPTQAWQAWERFTVENHNNGGIAISVQSPSGKRYFQHSGTGNITANATGKNGNNTKFTWESLGGNDFALKTASGKYVMVPQNAQGNPVLNSSANALGDWEKLTFTTLSGSARTTGAETATGSDVSYGLDETGIEAQTQISLYPNPAIDQLTIRGLAKAKLIQVLDLNGRVLSEQQVSGHSVTLPVGNLKPGLYLVRVDGSQTRKFIKR